MDSTLACEADPVSIPDPFKYFKTNLSQNGTRHNKIRFIVEMMLDRCHVLYVCRVGARCGGELLLPETNFESSTPVILSMFNEESPQLCDSSIKMI